MIDNWKDWSYGWIEILIIITLFQGDDCWYKRVRDEWKKIIVSILKIEPVKVLFGFKFILGISPAETPECWTQQTQKDAIFADNFP